MKKIIKAIRQKLCRHRWEYCVTPFGLYICCTKCGKFKKTDIYS